MSEIDKGISIVRLLKEVLQFIHKNAENGFKEMGITASQGMLMKILSHTGPKKVSELSDIMGISNSTVSGIIDRLEKRGFVERKRSNEDRRVVYVDVTSEFKNDAKKNFKQVEKKIDSIVNQATKEEIDKVFEGLNILKDIMSKQNQDMDN
ncbi:MarR family winged helix-turn-helix transcriptional regulator [Dethiothermospora halolimnae]|uniref:MarR family winged helix-turn-helix transcriptional regulator n=1 Tax=Dethiothermospora halolimnae TaxID=3114390 RepID=UPI003CCBEA1B